MQFDGKCNLVTRATLHNSYEFKVVMSLPVRQVTNPSPYDKIVRIPVGSAIFINSLTTVNIVRAHGDVFEDSSLVVNMLTIMPNQFLQIFGAEGDNMKKT